MVHLLFFNFTNTVYLITTLPNLHMSQKARTPNPLKRRRKLRLGQREPSVWRGKKLSWSARKNKKKKSDKGRNSKTTYFSLERENWAKLLTFNILEAWFIFMLSYSNHLSNLIQVFSKHFQAWFDIFSYLFCTLYREEERKKREEEQAELERKLYDPNLTIDEVFILSVN